MQVRHGHFESPVGRATKSAGWTFTACVGGLSEGVMVSRRLKKHVEGTTLPKALRGPISGDYEAAWVRARIPRVFAYEPAAPEVDKTLLWETFVAIKDDVGYVFACSDHYGKASLGFDPQGPNDATCDAIAAAFWSLLLTKPDDLADFKARVHHAGAGVWLDYTCNAGEVRIIETPE